MNDRALTTAHHDLLALDHIIAKLCDKLGDHIDSNAEFVDAEDRREAALLCLATIKARSPAALCAKAKALRAASLADDLDRTAALGRSLANDVVAYFSRAN